MNLTTSHNGQCLCLHFPNEAVQTVRIHTANYRDLQVFIDDQAKHYLLFPLRPTSTTLQLLHALGRPVDPYVLCLALLNNNPACRKATLARIHELLLTQTRT